MEKIPAAVTLALCVVMLWRLIMGARRRDAFDARVLAMWAQIGTFSQRVVHWRSDRRRAAAAAREAIRRARAAADVRRDGNVYHPDSFRDPRKPH